LVIIRRRRFLQERIEGLLDGGATRKAQNSPNQVAAVIDVHRCRGARYRLGLCRRGPANRCRLLADLRQRIGQDRVGDQAGGAVVLAQSVGVVGRARPWTKMMARQVSVMSCPWLGVIAKPQVQVRRPMARTNIPKRVTMRKFYKGLLIGLPISLTLWAGLAASAVHVAEHHPRALAHFEILLRNG
jgi:hypothetical protein